MRLSPFTFVHFYTLSKKNGYQFSLFDFHNPRSQPLSAVQAETVSPTVPQIILADGERAGRSSLQQALELEGYEVRWAGNGQQVLDLHAADPCDVTILDLAIPNTCGWDTFEELSRTDPLVPVIMLTSRKRQLRLARAAGVGALFEKPIQHSMLIKAIEILATEDFDIRLGRLVGRGHTLYEPRSLPPRYQQ